MPYALQGKICLVTGATSGIGKATVQGLAQMGATVVIVCRDHTRGETLQRELQSQYPHATIEILQADLSSLQSVRKLAEDFTQQYQQLHVLINNAGVFQLGRSTTVDGLETTFVVNHLAPFLLTNLLLDILKASAPARVIHVSSDAHLQGYIDLNDLQSTKRYKTMQVYGQSKLAMTLCSYELARRLEGTGVTVNALHPGFVATNIGQNNAPPWLRPLTRFLLSLVSIRAEEGAKTTLYLASSPDVTEITGKYFVKGIPRRSHTITYDEKLQHDVWKESVRLIETNT